MTWPTSVVLIIRLICNIHSIAEFDNKRDCVDAINNCMIGYNGELNKKAKECIEKYETK